MTPAETKKWRERRWAEEASRLLNRSWALGNDREEPDFIVRDADQTFGLEVTLAFQDSTSNGQSKLRQREAFSAKRLKKLGQAWAEFSNVILQVKVLGRLTDQNEREILPALKDFRMHEKTVADPPERIETSSGVLLFARVAFRSRWSQVDDSVGWVTQDAVDQAQASIHRKALGIPRYRAAAGEDVRLLIVADHSRASGMLELESVEALDLAGFSAAYFMTFPGGPIREILLKLPEA